MYRPITFSLHLLLLIALASCDKVPLLAPTNSSVSIDAQTRVLPTGGSTTVTATVIESSGTPVQNGTTVRFTTTLGRVEPVEAQTRNGMATTTFFAGNDSGIAEVRATSGSAGGGTTTTPPPSTGDNGNGGTTTPPTSSSTSNVVQIAVGSGAVDTVTVRANPSSVSTGAGGTVNVIATVVGTGGRLLSGIPVSFSATRGTLSSTTATTDAQGEARVTLTTDGETDISVAAGTKTATTKVTGRAGPGVTLTCAVAGATCGTAIVGQTVTFTASRAAQSATLTSAVLDFGDGSSVNLGTLSSEASVPHVYSQPGSYTARLTGTDANGESATAVQGVQVSQASASLSVAISAAPRTVTATATVTGTVTQYQWSWGDNTPVQTTANPATHTYAAAGQYNIVVTATLQGGATITANATIVVP
jgi:PKD repeat protein